MKTIGNFSVLLKEMKHELKHKEDHVKMDRSKEMPVFIIYNGEEHRWKTTLGTRANSMSGTALQGLEL